MNTHTHTDGVLMRLQYLFYEPATCACVCERETREGEDDCGRVGDGANFQRLPSQYLVSAVQRVDTEACLRLTQVCV